MKTLVKWDIPWEPKGFFQSKVLLEDQPPKVWKVNNGVYSIDLDLLGTMTRIFSTNHLTTPGVTLEGVPYRNNFHIQTSDPNDPELENHAYQ